MWGEGFNSDSRLPYPRCVRCFRIARFWCDLRGPGMLRCIWAKSSWLTHLGNCHPGPGVIFFARFLCELESRSVLRGRTLVRGGAGERWRWV